MKVKVLFLVALTLGLIQVSFAQESPNDFEKRKGYLIGPGDKIEGKVLGEPEFNFEAFIDEDGKFQVPFFERGIVAKCRTEKELRADVAQLLSKYLKKPKVSVRVIERNSRPPVTVYGEVRKISEITLTREATLLDMLSVAGGPTDKAGGMVQIIRTKPPMCSDSDEKLLANEGRVPAQYYSLSGLESGREGSNPVIYPGDVIVVPEAPPVYIVGEVNVIGKEILITENGLPLMQAISQAGGPRSQAKTKDIKIYRRVEGSPDPKIISVNYDLIIKGEQKDVMLEPFDIVEVDKANKSIGQYLLEFATGGVTNLSRVLPQRVLY